MNYTTVKITAKEKLMMLFFALITSVSFVTTFRSCEVTIKAKPVECDSTAHDTLVKPTDSLKLTY